MHRAVLIARPSRWRCLLMCQLVGSWLLGLVLAATPLACAGTSKQGVSAQSAATVKGTLAPAEEITIHDVEATVELLDLSPDSAGKPPLATRKFKPSGRPPYAFVLPYPLGKIQRERGYGVTARLTGREGTWATTEPVRVLTMGQSAEAILKLHRRPQ